MLGGESASAFLSSLQSDASGLDRLRQVRITNAQYQQGLIAQNGMVAAMMLSGGFYGGYSSVTTVEKMESELKDHLRSWDK